MSFARYPTYKDSGVEWLGEVPGHWGVSRLGFEAWVRARLGWKGLKAEEYVDDGFAFLATPNLKATAIDFVNVNFITQERYDESPEIKLAVGDVLLVKDGATLGIVNIVRHLPRPTTVNGSIAVITPDQSLNGLFLSFLFASSTLQQLIQRVKGGMGVPHLFQSDLNKFDVPLPPLDEQLHIAAFLDRETAKIDALVAEQQRLIELLKEKRQAVISHAVTKGLNPDAPMKDSGIEWLGHIPAHWAVTTLRRCTKSIETGGTPATHPPVADTDNGCVWYTPGDFRDSLLLGGSTRRIAADAVATGDAKLFPPGSVLIVSIGATLGKVGFAKDAASANQQINAAIPNDRIDGYFLAYALSVKVGHY